MEPPSRVFLLSPASTSGLRAQLLLRDKARFELALDLRSAEGASIGSVFAFLSGLYFRGKLAYANRFAPGAALVITAASGLISPDARIGVEELRRHARVPIAATEAAYRQPFERDIRALRKRLGGRGEVVLLGSIATDKYVGPLLESFGPRLLFPPAFVGRGDMSRGGLLLRAAREGREIDYAPVAGAARRGPRPPKLDPRTRIPA